MWFYFVTGLGSQGQLYDVSALLSDKGKSDSLELAIFSAPDAVVEEMTSTTRNFLLNELFQMSHV